MAQLCILPGFVSLLLNKPLNLKQDVCHLCHESVKMSMENGILREQHGIMIHATSIWYSPWSNINIMQKANTLGFMLCQHLRGAFWSSATVPNCASSRSYQNTNNQCGWEWVNFKIHEFPMFVLGPGNISFWEDSWTIENESCSLFKPCGKKHPRSQATHPRHPSLLHLVTAIVIETSAGHNCIQGPEPKQELPKPGTSSSYSSCGLKCCHKEWFEMRN